jgi:3-oxoacyl-[acyl-carrier-protein] synthase-1
MEEMLVSAVAEALGASGAESGGEPLTCLIALPEARPGLPQDIARSMSVAIATAFGWPAAGIHVIQRGHAAGLMAVQLAAQKVAAGEMNVCIAAGVDSYHDPITLDWLDDEGMLMSAENRNGFPPSEAAGACLIATPSYAHAWALPILARIKAAITTIEPHPIHSDGVCVGEGLTAVLNGVAASLALP